MIAIRPKLLMFSQVKAAAVRVTHTAALALGLAFSLTDNFWGRATHQSPKRCGSHRGFNSTQIPLRVYASYPTERDQWEAPKSQGSNTHQQSVLPYTHKRVISHSALQGAVCCELCFEQHCYPWLLYATQGRAIRACS